MLHHARCLGCNTTTMGISKILDSRGRAGFPPCPRCGGERVLLIDHPLSTKRKALLKAQADLQHGGLWK